MTTLAPNPALFEGLAGGLSAALLGPPGTGKSSFLGSCGRLGPAKLLAAKPREANSWLYRETGITADAEVFHDPHWRPTLGMYEADAYVRFLKRVWELYDDKTYDFILVDPFTDLASLAAHELLKKHKASTPRETPDSQGYYGELKFKLEEVTQALTALQFAPKPKHVLVSVHVQAPKEDTQLSRAQGGGTKESQDNRKAGIEYEGNVLPMIEGGYRTKFAGEFDIVLFSDIKHGAPVWDATAKRSVAPLPEYIVQIQPDADRHAKQTIGAVFANKEIPNDFGALLDLLRGNVKDERNKTT